MINHYVPYTITLRAPAILSALGDDPNSTRTLCYIPGSAFRGRVAQALGDAAVDPQRQELFRSLILDGSACYLNCYPRVAGHRTLPTPISFQNEKNALAASDGAIEGRDLAAFTGEVDEHEDLDWPETALSRVKEEFASLTAAQPLRITPKRGSRVHQQRDRSVGRPWKESANGHEIPHGSVFTYEYLEAGQEFDGIIRVHAASEEECDAFINQVKECLTPPILFGRSRRGGYGGNADIQWHSPIPREVAGESVFNNDLEPGAMFRLLTTSHYIGRNQGTGQIDPTYLAQEIEGALTARARVCRKRWAFELVGGFNRKWRLELPQVLTCAAGSVLVLQAEKRIPLADLLTVEHAGLGERQVEGFGRIVFLTQPAATPFVIRTERSVQQNISLPKIVPELVSFAQDRMLQEELSRTIAEEAARLAGNAKLSRPFSPSLLGRLRTALRASPEAAIGTLQTWLDEKNSEHSLRRPALDQLERCRVDEGKSLTAWIREITQMNDDGPIRQLLSFDMVAQRFQVISEESVQQSLAERGAWIRARLIDEVLESLARRLRQ